MKSLDNQYLSQLEELVNEIVSTEAYDQFMESEEEEDYRVLVEAYEPRIEALYQEVAAADPMQLKAFEMTLTDENFLGLYMPRILGFSILRGSVNDEFKYHLPNDHYRIILLSICKSVNFDYIKKRIGQGIQVGFALSSDIWITNLINELDNKRVKYFLKNQKILTMRDKPVRQAAYIRYKRQFDGLNYMATAFPKTFAEMKMFYPGLKSFMYYRIQKHDGNVSIHDEIEQVLTTEDIKKAKEYVNVLCLYNMFFNLDEERTAANSKVFNEARTGVEKFEERFFDFIVETQMEKEIEIDSAIDKKISVMIDRSHEDELVNYYDLLDTIHSKGYIDEAVMDKIQAFCLNYEGLSNINAAVRQTILVYIKDFMNGIEPTDYLEWFEMNKIFVRYMNIFSNQHFSQSIKSHYLKYVRRCLKVFTDKRAKDYQEVKKFVSNNFDELGFLNAKEIKEFFKTKRKKKAV